MHAGTVGFASARSFLPLRSARSASSSSPHRTYAATRAPCVAAFGRTPASLMARSAARTPSMSPKRPRAAMRVLYKRAPAATPRRFISRTNASPSVTMPCAMNAPTAAVYA